ncbi:MAG: GldG family protein [Myxococcota bacterium]|nr:GldG family protein [Myxococcota bacterium]MDW8361757.1 Gldg family protein [Myxococcales bacterium]
MLSSRRVRTASESLGFLLLIGGILVALNVVGFFVHHRLDLTEKGLFSLSDGSRKVAQRLTDTLEVTAYFTEDLPPPHNATERHVLDLLDEYRAASNGRLVVKLVRPDTDDEKEQAERDGVVRVAHTTVRNDSVQQVEGYRGLVLRYLDRSEVIPAIESTEGLEYQLTMKIKELVGDRTPIGLLGGHDGPTLSKGLSRLRDCLPTYDVREVSATSEIARDLRALLVVEPRTPLSETELRYINQYVMRGGSLGVFGGSMKIDLEGFDPSAQSVDTGLNRLLRRWGVEVREGLVADARCGRVPMPSRLGIPVLVPHPVIPIVRFDEAAREHPATFRLDGAHLPFVSPLRLVPTNDSQIRVRTLARSSDEGQSWTYEEASVSLRPRPPQEWRMEGPAGPFPLIVAIEGKLPSAFGGSQTPSGQMSAPDAGAENAAPEAPAVEAPARAERDVRVFVVGGSFLLRDEIQGPQGHGETDCNLSGPLGVALNAIDWLAQDDDLIAVRAKNIADSPLDVPQNVRQAEQDALEAHRSALEAAAQGDEQTAEARVRERDAALERGKRALEEWDARKARYRWGNMLGLPAAVALFGVVRWQLRKRQRARLSL